jgi:hypothetical protein
MVFLAHVFNFVAQILNLLGKIFNYWIYYLFIRFFNSAKALTYDESLLLLKESLNQLVERLVNNIKKMEVVWSLQSSSLTRRRLWLVFPFILVFLIVQNAWVSASSGLINILALMVSPFWISCSVLLAIGDHWHFSFNHVSYLLGYLSLLCDTVVADDRAATVTNHWVIDPHRRGAP